MNRKTFLKSSGLFATCLTVGGPSMLDTLKVHGDHLSAYPHDNQQALVNPQMGWTMHYYSNLLKNYGSRLAPSDTVDDFPGLSTVYLRIPWSFVEVEEGVFNWEVLDTPAQRWIQEGKKVAFRITAQESWMKYATPKWAVEDGAKGYEIENGRLWEPKYDDPIFLKKVNNFVAAMGARYDDNPHVAFVDVGHYGMWGEGHTVTTTKIKYPLDVKKRFIDIYLKHFQNTLLCISDDYAGHDKPGAHFPITDYALSKGVTIRDDSILVGGSPDSKPWYHAEMAQAFWPTLPVILEHQHYGQSVEKGHWSKKLFLKSIEAYHASYMSIHWWPRILLRKNRKVIHKINMRMGYRLHVKQITWPKHVEHGQSFKVKWTWANAGVAPCYPGGYPCLTIKDKKGGIVSVLVDDQFNVMNLKTGTASEAPERQIKSEFTVGSMFKGPVKTFTRNVQTGTFDLYVSVGMRDGTPVFELPYNEHDGYKRYKIGHIIVEKS